MTRASTWLFAGCLATSTFAITLPVQAQSRQVVIYRCTDAAGHVTLQNDVACPAGTHQQKQGVDAPTSTPAYVPRADRMPAIVAQEQAQAEADIAQALPPPVPVADRVAPPALFECSTWDQLSYLTEEATPRESCRPLQVVGIDGISRPGASACEQVLDQCTAVPTKSLCHGWKRRVDEAEFRWKFAGAKDDGSRRLDYEKLAATYANSTCAP